ncbi:MAG: YlxR family protein [Anaerolineae bacterium]|jgi:uncharacterized protein
MGKGQKQPRRTKHIPQRTCIVCRRKVDKRQLTRIVRTPDAGVVVDPTGKRNGRGAYVCERPDCWDKLTENGQLINQTLKTTVTAAELTAIAAFKPEQREMGVTQNQERLA